MKKAKQKKAHDVVVKRHIIYDLVHVILILFFLFDVDYSKSGIKIKFINNFDLIVPLMIYIAFYALFFLRKIKVKDEKIIFVYFLYKFIYKKEEIENIKIKFDMRFSYIQVIIRNKGKRRFYYAGININNLKNKISLSDIPVTSN